MRLIAIAFLLALTACGKPNKSTISSEALVFPVDPIAAGYDQPLFKDAPPTEDLLAIINEAHDNKLANLENEVVSVSIPDSEILDLDASETRRPEDRSHDDGMMEAQDTSIEDEARPYTSAPIKRKAPKTPTATQKPKNWDNVLSGTDTKNITVGSGIGGPAPYTLKDTQLFVPASIAKNISVMRALETLGPNYRFETKAVWRDEGDGIAAQFTVTGNGDPTLGASDFNDDDFGRLRQLVRDIKKAGVKEIRGPIIFVSADKRWDKPIHAPGVEASDNGWCYGALSQAFNLHSNCATVIVSGVNQAAWRDAGIRVPIKTEMTVAKKTVLSRQIFFDSEGRVTGFGLTGTIAKNQKDFALMFPVPDSKTWVRNVFMRHLSEERVRYNPNQPIRGNGPVKSASSFSPQLQDIIVPLLKESDNFLADTLFKRAALNAYPNLPLREAAQMHLNEGIKAWAAAAGFPHMKDEMLLLDGAGLSRNNRSSPRAYLTLMQQFTLSSSFRKLWAALPIAGIDGTLKNRLQNSAVKGIARAKTGTLRGSYQLAGFMPQFENNGTAKAMVPFVILTATPDGMYGSKVFKIQEKLLVRLSQLINPKLPPPENRRP